MAVTYDRIWGVIPHGFKKIVDGAKHRMVVRADLKSSVRVEMCTAAYPPSEMSHFHGRGKLKSVMLANGETALVRAYHHGGLFGSITGRIFLAWPARPFRELAITEEIRRRGVPTVEVYGACTEIVWGPFYRAWLITRELEGAQDLWAACQNGLFVEMGRERVLRAVAAALRKLHREGVYHSDLNMKNILIRAESEGVRGYIIDFDRARLLLGQVPRQLADRNLKRLLRSVRKLDPERSLFTIEDWECFMAWYHEAA